MQIPRCLDTIARYNVYITIEIVITLHCCWHNHDVNAICTIEGTSGCCYCYLDYIGNTGCQSVGKGRQN